MRRTFAAATRACAVLESHYRPGLQALRNTDRERLCAADPCKLAGSVDIDRALAAELPNASRWDYGIGYRPASKGDDVVHWVEVHPATEGEISAIAAKLAWLKEWIGSNAVELAEMDRRFVWVSSGRTRLSPTSPALKRLAQMGCCNVGRCYKVQ